MSNTYTHCPYCLEQATGRTRGIPTYDLCNQGHRWRVEEGIVPKTEERTALETLLHGETQIRRVNLHARSEDTAVTLHCRVRGVGTEYTFSVPDGVGVLLLLLSKAQAEAQESQP